MAPARRLLPQSCTTTAIQPDALDIDPTVGGSEAKIVENAPQLRPSLEEMDNFLQYISSKEDLLREFGGMHVLPPTGWKEPTIGCNDCTKFFVRKQQLPLECGKGDATLTKITPMKRAKDRVTFLAYKNTALRFEKAVRKRTKVEDKDWTTKFVELQFWKTCNSGLRNEIVRVTYGSDIDLEGENPSANQPSFAHGWRRDYYGDGPKWHVGNINRGSLLRHLPVLPGINRPMYYIGQLFTRFSWHVEDAFLNSISYLHRCSHSGKKIWYVVPPSSARQFEEFVGPAKFHPILQADTASAQSLLETKTVLYPPADLVRNGVRVFRIEHTPGSFVVTAPRAYHCGFNTGFTVAEAANFALPDWFTVAKRAEVVASPIAKQLQVPREYLLFQEACDIASDQSPFRCDIMCARLIARELAFLFSAGEKAVERARAELDWAVTLLSDLSVRPFALSFEETNRSGALCGVCSRNSYFLTAICLDCEEVEARCTDHWGYGAPICSEPSHRMTVLRRHDPQYVLDILELCEEKGGISLTSNEKISRQREWVRPWRGTPYVALAGKRRRVFLRIKLPLGINE